MMNRLDLYITRHVLGAILIVMLVIVGLDLLFALVDQLPDLNDGYKIKDAAIYVGLTAPRRFYEHLPLCSLIGCLLGLGTLATSSELTVMRAAGVSTLRIIGAVMKPVVLLIAAGFMVGEYVVPTSEQTAQSYRTIAVSKGQGSVYRLERGLWHREGGTFLHVKAVTTEGEIFGITRYRFSDNWTLESASVAEKGYRTTWIKAERNYESFAQL